MIHLGRGLSQAGNIDQSQPGVTFRAEARSKEQHTTAHDAMTLC